MARERIINLRHLSIIESSDRRLSSSSNPTDSDHPLLSTHESPRSDLLPHHDPSTQEDRTEALDHQAEEDEDETKICSATRNDDLSTLSNNNPSIHNDHLQDLQPSTTPSSELTSFDHLITMGQFMDQVSKLSNLIDSIRFEFDQNQSNLIQDSNLRSKVLRTIQDDIIHRFLRLDRSIHSIQSQPQSQSPPSTTTDPTIDSSEKLALISQDAHQIEYQLKLDQIRTLHSNLNSILQRFLSLLRNERQIIIDQIEFEWTKELNPPNQQHPSSIPPSTPTDLTQDLSSNSSHFQALTPLGLDLTDPQSASELDSELVLKRLKVAVRNSTSYPQARQSSIFIQSKLQIAQQLQTEVHQLDKFIQTISQHHHSRPPSLADDSSSLSMSLDGLGRGERDFKPPYESQPRITFELPSKLDQYGTTYPKDYNVVDLENNLCSDPRRSLVSSNHSYHSSPATLCGFPASRKRTVILVCCVASLLLAIVAVAIFLALSLHDN